MTLPVNRRDFVLGSAAGLGYFYTAEALSAARAADGPNGKVHIAGIGVGGKGSSDIDQAGDYGQVVAICDVDDGTLNGKAGKFPGAKKYNDFRKMFDEMEKQIDGVTVSTPDHTHFHPSFMAMLMKKAVYCQKPLTHSVWEARILRETAKKMGVATQMGNQGSAETGLRRAVELIQGGAIGAVKEIHVWTNRPVWPQSPKVKERPPEAPVPKNLHWDLWLGPVAHRPYALYPASFGRRGAYHDFNWRGWWDFGTGALGDMACHTANMAFRAAKLGFPSMISAKSEELNPETYPAWASVDFTFPARDEKLFPECHLYWYEGRKDNVLVHPPKDLQAKVLKKGEALVSSGSIIVGDKGILYSPNDYGAAFRVYSVDGMALPAPSMELEHLPKNGLGDGGMKKEWIEAIKGGPAAYSAFDFAGMITEAILLGNVGMRAGKPLEWDGPNFKITNNEAANAFLKTEYIKGWEVKIA